MNPEFTTAAEQLIGAAAQRARTANNPALEPLHILAETLTQEFCRSLYQALGANIPALSNTIEAELKRLPTIQGGELTISPAAQALIRSAQKIATEMGDQYVSIELLCMLFLQAHSLHRLIKNLQKITVRHNLLMGSYIVFERENA